MNTVTGKMLSGCAFLMLFITGCGGSSNSSGSDVSTSPTYDTSFANVTWVQDFNNVPDVEEYGCGDAPSSSTSTTDTFTFTLTGCTSGTQRQEFKYERRTGLHSMEGVFRFTGADFTKDNGISIAQTHDDRTGSDGVFSIYRLHSHSDGSYSVMPQTDESSYRNFEWATVLPDTDYYMDIQTWSDGAGSFERARLWEGDSANGALLAEWIINDGSGDDVEQYKKIGAYALTGAYGELTVYWRNVQLFTGSW
ncbi:hypothetical protein EOL70_06745 [Leucothrix sargassi]|nr:hypothetical protein EOL70_06745 [Leucothrix sargassi]